MSGLGRQVMQLTAEYKRKVEHRIKVTRAHLEEPRAEEFNGVQPVSARAGSSKFSAEFSNKQFGDPLSGYNAKMTAQLEDDLRAAEQRLVPLAKLEDDLFSRIEDECIQAVN